MGNSFEESGINKNRFLYQSKEWQTELSLNLYDFHARQFDPALGRWLATDPQDQFMSPYLGMANSPAYMIDPDGELSLKPFFDGIVAGIEFLVQTGQFIVRAIGIANALNPTNNFNGCPPTCPKGTTFSMDNKTFTTVEGGILGHNNPYANPVTRSPTNIKPIGSKPFVRSFTPPGFQANLSPLKSRYTISASKQGFFQRWAQNSNIFASISYDLTNGVYLTAQMLYKSPTNRYGLDGFRVTTDEMVNGFVSTAGGGVFGLAAAGGRRSINQLNKLIRTGKMPKSIIRFDKGKIFAEVDHVHFSNGAALNVNGTWKHGFKTLTNKEIKVLSENGWIIP